MVEWKCWSVREQRKTLHWRCILTVVSGWVSLGGFPGLPSHPARVPTRVPMHQCSVLSVIPRLLLGHSCVPWAAGSDQDCAVAAVKASPRQGAVSGVAASCSAPRSCGRSHCSELYALCSEQALCSHRDAEPWLGKVCLCLSFVYWRFRFFSQHCFFARGVCCIKSQCFPQWWEKSPENIWSRGSRWSFALGCSWNIYDTKG